MSSEERKGGGQTQKQIGRVVRVSGPVVIAEDLVGAKMFDVVRVGELGLVGEIIRIIGNEATIQVYEDTTGMRPGDRVENTGEALSVELGPGLLSSIYDGVQRPLDVLMKQGGDFISRGFISVPLDTTKKWEFIAQRKKGDSVAGGDVLGTVTETPLIQHKIMVPPGLSGTLVSLSSGTYTIRDKIGSLQTEGRGEVPLTLAHRWQVRMQRPVKKKLPPQTPLITGQRVIDGFFPVAKGGTAAIPGPFGSGKCVSGDTPIALGDGKVVALEELYHSARGTGTMRSEGSDEWITLGTPIELISLVGGQLVKSRTQTLYKGKSDSIVRVKTRSGRTVKVTPVHKLFKMCADGVVRPTAARDIKEGDYLAAVRRLPSQQGRAAINVSLPHHMRRGHSMTVPDTMSPEFAEFLGLFVSQGYIRGERTIVFASSDKVLLDRFVDLANILFGLEAHLGVETVKTPKVLLHSRLLVDLVRSVSAGGTASEKRIPPAVLSSDNEVLGRFLSAYYLGEGSCHDGQVEFSTESRGLQTDLAYSMARFGVTPSLAVRTIDGSPHFRVIVKGLSNLTSLERALHSTNPKVAAISSYIESKKTTCTSTGVAPLPTRLTNTLYWSIFDDSAMMDEGGEVHDCMGNGKCVGTATFQRMVQAYKRQDVDGALVSEAGSISGVTDWLIADEVVEIAEDAAGPFDVYDFSVPQYGSNFVGGHGGLVLHNTVTQQQLAKWAEADVVVYVGCGERGNEMTEVLSEFPKLEDPKTKRPLMERTILIANTSNMPVAAREASIYTGITIAEYYRDMGYDVALMADSTSRWAEALREISGRLEEMPGEEGYPAYLGRRLAEFYERSGKVVVIGGEAKEGSITVIGAVSPPGGDTSEPVSQNTLRVTRVFWALDASLANRRHFPSINWLTSYSLYLNDLRQWYAGNVSKDWVAMRNEAMALLQKEAELQEIVQLVGSDALPEREKGVLDVARMIREDYLQQSAYDEVDTYTSIRKQYLMLRNILKFGSLEKDAINRGVPLARIVELPIRERLARMKTTSEKDGLEAIEKVHEEMIEVFSTLKGGELA